MSGLDTVIAELDKLAKLKGDTGIAGRMLSTFQNGLPGILILDALYKTIQQNGGYADLNGGLTLGIDAQLAQMIGLGASGSIDAGAVSISGSMLLNGSSLSLKASYSDASGWQLGPDLEMKLEIGLPNGVRLHLAISDMERRDGHTVKATFTAALSVGLKGGEVFSASAAGGPFLQITAYDYQWYVENRFSNVLYEIAAGGEGWEAVRSTLNLPASVDYNQFVQAVVANGSSGNFIMDIARTAAKLSPNSTSGVVKLATNFANPQAFVQSWYPGLDGLTSAGAAPGAFATYNRGASGEITIEVHYYQDTTTAGGNYFAQRYFDATGQTREIHSAQVRTFQYFDAQGNVISGPDGQPLFTRIVFANQPYNPNASISGSPVEGTVIVTYWDPQQGRYVTSGVEWDEHTVEELVGLLRENALDPSKFITSRQGANGEALLQFVDRTLAGDGTSTIHIETPGLTSLGEIIAQVTNQSEPLPDNDENDVIVVTGYRLPGNFDVSEDVSIKFSSDPGGPLEITYEGREGEGTQTQIVSDPAIVARAREIAATGNEQAFSDFGRPIIDNSVLLSEGFAVSKDGEVAILQGTVRSE